VPPATTGREGEQIKVPMETIIAGVRLIRGGVAQGGEGERQVEVVLGVQMGPEKEKLGIRRKKESKRGRGMGRV